MNDAEGKSVSGLELKRPSGEGDADRFVLIVGAGPAGLATSFELKRRRIPHVVLEKGPSVGHKWANLYDSLTLHTGKHLSALPGTPFPSNVPLFPSRNDFLHYLRKYASTHQLPIQSDCAVSKIKRLPHEWRILTTKGERKAKTLVMATGILSNPHVPEFPDGRTFQGRTLHSVDYRRPEPFRGERVLVIGAGNSAGEISTELVRAGIDVTISIRSGATTLPLSLFGIPIQYFGVLTARLPETLQKKVIALTAWISALRRGPVLLPKSKPSPCPDVPLIGFHLIDAIRERRIRMRGGIDRFTKGGVRFKDGSEDHFESIIFATGYHAAIDTLEGLVRMDRCGFAFRRDRVVSIDRPDLYFVGQNYDARGGLYNITLDSKRVAGLIANKM